MRAKLLAAIPLIAAALVNLPVVYRLVAWGGASPYVALGFGFLAMGLAWGAGFVIEGKRRWIALLTCVLGIAEGIAALTPIERLLGDGVRGWLGASGVLSAAALVLVVRL